MSPALANAALRGIFKRAVINWPQGTIDLEWTHGGVCSIPYALSQAATRSPNGDIRQVVVL
jgi:hypothetical protein